NSVGETGARISEILSKIAESVSVQKKISEDIKQSVLTTEEISDLMVSINSSSSQQTGAMVEITLTATKLNDLAEELKNSLSKTSVKKEAAFDEEEEKNKLEATLENF
ncbi:hypothetical protein LCGC14_1255180, partial [marine sediment metagenome]